MDHLQTSLESSMALPSMAALSTSSTKRRKRACQLSTAEICDCYQVLQCKDENVARKKAKKLLKHLGESRNPRMTVMQQLLSMFRLNFQLQLQKLNRQVPHCSSLVMASNNLLRDSDLELTFSIFRIESLAITVFIENDDNPDGSRLNLPEEYRDFIITVIREVRRGKLESGSGRTAVSPQSADSHLQQSIISPCLNFFPPDYHPLNGE
ncbi:hypothetical protein BJ508DRAFT_315116 [Ascobolus immersus RN42]|uniref:Uncharacterized protein n=1 Tax=Ascobolus immersus RN42 TaxID=1160509 RepID=A0A3N4HJ40_ASCIM|nr:hypothetical protein BJ508DRAFT_315116 [Ascobolus immersus RN42]